MTYNVGFHKSWVNYEFIYLFEEGTVLIEDRYLGGVTYGLLPLSSMEKGKPE